MHDKIERYIRNMRAYYEKLGASPDFIDQLELQWRRVMNPPPEFNPAPKLGIGCRLNRFGERYTLLDWRRYYGKLILSLQRWSDGVKSEDFSELYEHAEECPCRGALFNPAPLICPHCSEDIDEGDHASCNQHAREEARDAIEKAGR